MIKRDIRHEIMEMAGQYPIVTLLGPRQSGKTTLVKSLFPEKTYINLETPDNRDYAAHDARALLAQCTHGAIFDEIQRAPWLLSYIQEYVDSHPGKGIFILTGSHQLALHEAVSQSLAGRTAILKLLPLTIHELRQSDVNFDLDHYIYTGFYPRIYQDNLNPTKAYLNYFETYVERDVRQIINIKDLGLFEKFMRLTAGRIGQLLDYTNLSNEVGVSSHTIKQWLSVLQASFLIYQLPPYFENFNKRLVKSPKLYFTDVGLACYLLGISTITQLMRDPLRGHLVENLVVMELVKQRFNQGLEPSLYFYRDNHQNEVDIIFKSGHQLIPAEIKSSSTFHRDYIKSLDYFLALTQERSPRAYLIYAGDKQNLKSKIRIINYQNSNAIFEEE